MMALTAMEEQTQFPQLSGTAAEHSELPIWKSLRLLAGLLLLLLSCRAGGVTAVLDWQLLAGGSVPGELPPGAICQFWARFAFSQASVRYSLFLIHWFSSAFSRSERGFGFIVSAGVWWLLACDGIERVCERLWEWLWK